MQSTNQPPKFLIPFAQNDSAKVEIPATTTDPARFSQSLGSPPATGMPPEAGGVPPQLEDFNGALNQQSRVAWWLLAGGRFGYDSTWANDTLIGGYASGAVLPSADKAGEWYNTSDNNVADPDSNGANWVPGYHYGAYALTGLTGGTINLFPSSAAKRVLTVSGTLAANQVLVMPNWLYDWVIYNNTSGAFSVTVKTAAGTGAVIPQNGAPTPIRGDGTNISLLSANIAPATSASQAARFDQVNPGRFLGVQRITASGTYTPTAGTNRIVVELLGGGAAGGGAQSSTTLNGIGAGGGAGAYVRFLLDTVPASVAVTIGAGGTGVTGGVGNNGNISTFGTYATAGGGTGGARFSADSSVPNYGAAGGGGATVATVTGVGTTLLVAAQGSPGSSALSLGAGAYLIVGEGGPSRLGAVGHTSNTTGSATAPANSGAGGAGIVAAAGSASSVAGGSGGSGVCIVYEYA